MLKKNVQVTSGATLLQALQLLGHSQETCIALLISPLTFFFSDAPHSHAGLYLTSVPGFFWAQFTHVVTFRVTHIQLSSLGRPR